jgi:hypothetical protein
VVVGQVPLAITGPVEDGDAAVGESGHHAALDVPGSGPQDTSHGNLNTLIRHVTWKS